jgi:hypothetical protein
MKEPYSKGVANHPRLESCEGGRETALEALTDVYVGWVLRFKPTFGATSTFKAKPLTRYPFRLFPVSSQFYCDQGVGFRSQR